MEKYYGFSPEYTEKLLTKHGRVPSIIQRLESETDIRLTDPTAEGYVKEAVETFKERVNAFYVAAPEFAVSVKMPLVSYKQDKKFNGALTDDKALSKKEKKNTSIVKVDVFGNESVLSANKYYCLEIYKDDKNITQVRAIRYVDLVKRNKKLWLRYAYPEDYKSHVMYLFANDYIRIFNSEGVLKFEGYYQSVKNIFRNYIYAKTNNSNSAIVISIAKKDTVKKFDVDVLGKTGGEVKCSVSFMSLKENQ